ncbi:hypothetical protein [Rhodococcus sp. NPDC127528]
MKAGGELAEFVLKCPESAGVAEGRGAIGIGGVELIGQARLRRGEELG